jgi:hypothetical protein
MAYVPLIVQSDHVATLRLVDHEHQLYRLSFEGMGFAKTWPQLFKQPEDAFPLLRSLGFKQCRVLSGSGGYFPLKVKQSEWRDDDGEMMWFECYEHNDLISEEVYEN